MLPTVSEDLDRFVDQEVASGRYGSREEVVASALRRLQSGEKELESLRAIVRVGMDQLARGEGFVLADHEARRQYFEDIKQRGRESLRTEAPAA